ncbi:gliding motility-associated C-terminal domain-containing protein [Flavobacterium sp. D11R37]|uniref:gliding motility-associated C-terminal domain-containing protein n=1 Tax=Flavobacterium coralii TaxID=2838017 RepID=UPI001CA7229F|nr:gliding motility-associated C-terminal domain-containing protein [Flavobacterium coralii]MBY8963547.1 gliding motility-associated C-terminal domain-containing protein [Flavobacterium coralii]
MKNKILIIVILISHISYGKDSLPPVVKEKNNEFLQKYIIQQFFSSCEQNIALNNPEENIYYIYQAANSIRVSSNYKISGSNGSNITMKAGETIVLKQKTTIYRGSKYLGRIEPCEEDACNALTSSDIPRGISPNGDNLNDTFDLSGFCIKKINIFNRYGMLVYESTNYTNEWYGQHANGDLPSATYFYHITLFSGKQITGWVYVQK